MIGRARDILLAAVRFLAWATDLDDGSGSKDWTQASPSLAKLLGAACVAVGLWLAVSKRELTAPTNVLIAMGITAVFGRSMWKCWLGRNTWTSAFTTDTKLAITRNEQITRQVIEQRRATGEYEETP